VDYPGFNLRIATFARSLGIPVMYYISPQVWAWKAGRVKRIRRDVDELCVILPFERPWYAARGMDVTFVGHPLLDAIASETVGPPAELPGADGRPVIALLPGSRRQEVERMLPVMLEAAAGFPDHQCIVAAAPTLDDAVYAPLMGHHDALLLRDRTYAILRRSRAALVTSGTATLETALLGVPEVVCYSGSAVNVWLARRLVNVPFISLVNLIMEREVVRELIQDEMNTRNLVEELRGLLYDHARRERLSADYAALSTLLAAGGKASEAAADRIINLIAPN